MHAGQEPLLWAFEFGFSDWYPHARICRSWSQPVHEKLMFHYNYPMTSEASSIFHHLFDETKNPDCFTKPAHWYWDNSHGTPIIHQLGGYLLSKHFNDLIGAYESRNPSVALLNNFPQPWYVGAADHHSVISKVLSLVRFDVEKIDPLDLSVCVKRKIGFSHRSETVKKKWGLVGNTDTAFLELNVKGADFAMVEYLVSYANMSDAVVYFSNKTRCMNLPGNITGSKAEVPRDLLISETGNGEKFTTIQNKVVSGEPKHYLLRGLHKAKTSIPGSIMFKLNQKYRRMCIRKATNGPKFKVLSFQTKQNTQDL